MVNGEHRTTPSTFEDTAHFKIDDVYIDPYQHINHVAWGIYLDSGRTKLLHELLTPENRFLQRTEIEFKGQIKQGDEIEIATSAIDQQGSVRFDQQVIIRDQLVGKAISIYGNPQTELTISTEPSLLDLHMTVDEDFFLLHGNNIDYLAGPACFETERLRLLRSRGLTIDELTSMGILVMATSIDAHFAEKMHLGQQLDVRTTVHTQGVRIIFHQQMTEDNHVVNEAQTIYVPVDITGENPKIVRPSSELMKRLTGPQTVDVPYSKDLRWMK